MRGGLPGLRRRGLKVGGKPLTQERLAFCDVNTFITNVPEEAMSRQVIRTFYSLRWQVEIMFKAWKSVLGLDKVRNVRHEVFLCMLYGGLINMLLAMDIIRTVKADLWKTRKREVSDIKALGLLHRSSEKIRLAIITTTTKANRIIAQIILAITTTCIKDPKKNKPSPWNIIQGLA